MQMYYCAETAGFYSPAVHKGIPEGAVALTDEVYALLKNGLELGKQIRLDDDGQPVLVDRQVSLEEATANECAWRDAQLVSTEWLTARHRDELDMTGPTTLAAEQFAELLTYRQSLRDWPQSTVFPDSGQRPVALAWLIEQQL
ncbi:phage tail assembly chaperone [Pseudomonas shirazensis]|uniref:Phage tail assembly chaperone n=1 Tax=Pseudomonas shirazensis TaxID=2745494 RepID=A0ABU9A3E4_9PSED